MKKTKSCPENEKSSRFAKKYVNYEPLREQFIFPGQVRRRVDWSQIKFELLLS